MDNLDRQIPEIESEINNVKNTTCLTFPQVEDRRFHGDKDTLSDDEYEAQCASDLPSKQFSKWVHETVWEITRRLKLDTGCGRIWREAYNGLQMPNGKQIQCLSELIDESYVSYRYIFALRLVTKLNACQPKAKTEG